MADKKNTKALSGRLFKLVILLLSVSILNSGCAPSTSKGLIGTDGNPNNGKDEDLKQQGQRLIDTYQSRGSLPALGYKKVTEFSRKIELNSGEPCRYVIIESAVLVQKEPTVVIEYKYKQTGDKGNASSCPATDNHIVDYPGKSEFAKYAEERVGVFQNFSEANLFARNNAWVSTAQFIATQNTTFKNIDVLKVILKVVDHNRNEYLLETSFSSMSSFLGIVEQKLIRTKDGERISYRSLISTENPE